MTTRLLALVGTVTLLTSASPAFAGEKGATVERGRKYFGQLCVGCHGANATGSGPSAKAMVTPPADLTKIAARRSGKFNTKEVSKIIDGRYRNPTKGSTPMPAWGDVLGDQRASSDEPSREHRTRVIISDLVAFLKSIQVKAKKGN